MADDLITAATTPTETPSSDAAQSAANYITGALAAAQLFVNRSIRDQDGARTQQREDPIVAARRAYAPMLDRARGRQASSSVAMTAWQAALPFRDQYRDAARAAGRAEDRLRVLHPEALARYDALRAGLNPVQAMREVAPLIGKEIANPQARRDFAVMLTDTHGRSATSEQALKAWMAAVPLREHITDADVAASRAEDRLRQLHPEAMDRYDTLRTEHHPVEAARQAALLLDPSRETSTGEPVTAAPAQSGPGPAAQSDSNSTTSGSGNDQDGPETVPAHQRYAPAVNAALPPEMAAAVLADTAWPKLAATLERAEQAGAEPADLLATVVNKREISSAESTARVLTYRVEHHNDDTKTTTQPPVQEAATPAAETTDAVQDNTGPTQQAASDQVPAGATRSEHAATSTPPEANAATVAAQNFATPITDAAVPTAEPDVAAAAAAGALEREASVLADTARDAATTPDDRSTPAVDEHREGVVDAVALDDRATTADARAGALRSQGTAATAGTATGQSGAQPEQTGPSPAAVAAQNFATPLNQASTGQAAAAPSSQTAAPPPVTTQNTARRR